MAKGKHSTALFEVIHSAKAPGRIAQRMSTPKWWFKSRHRSGKTTGESQSTSRLAAQHASQGEVDNRPAELRKVEKRTHLEAENERRSSAVRVGFDRARQEFALRFRYTTAILCGFGLCAAVGIAYVVGRQMTNGPLTASASEQQAIGQPVLQQPARPSVMNVTKARATFVAAPLALETKQTALSNENIAPIKTVVSTLVPASANTELPRTVRLNYVVIATYPVEEQAKADTARAYFTKAGIPCSLETCNWAPKMISLVGTAGFVKVTAKDFIGYKDNIIRIARTMKTSQFDKPSPGVYSWKGDPTDKTFAGN